LLLANALPAQTTAPPADLPAGSTVKTSITVVEHIAAETPANVTSVTAQDLEATPGDNIDDRLRLIPGFSLFRRTSSVVANPTTQGVSLRGLGSSGASRSLVLMDGVPMNDPFGGWVYWTRFTPFEMERVEVSRGAASSVFGDLAMSGAINLFPVEPTKTNWGGGYEAGNYNTHDVWGSATEVWKNFAASVSTRGYTTDGYYVVANPIRGPIDRPAGVRFATGTVRLDQIAGPQRFYIALNALAEERANGTYLTHNSTGLGTASLHYLVQSGHNGLSLIGFRSQEQYHATFSQILNSRKTELLTSTQTVPSDSIGGSAIYNHAGAHWNVVAGADINNEHGFSTDHFPTTFKRGGGTLLEHGEFAQGDVQFGSLRMFAGGREETAAHHRYFNPEAGMVYGKSRWRARGSVYKSFRVPTLNELYRDFRAGNALTLANAALTPEKLFGGEIGADYIGESSSVRLSAYHNSIDSVITNVTLASTKTQITRQRQNAAAATSEGVEMEARKQYGAWTGELSYLYADSHYATGPLLAQVPKHQGSGQVTYRHNRTLVSASIRSYSYQFDDDRNQFILPGFASVGFVAHQQLSGPLAATASFENLLNHQYLTAFTPTPTIGTPRLWRVGLVWRR
jgi:outer membrane receptor protein involved in Fe transport